MKRFNIILIIFIFSFIVLPGNIGCNLDNKERVIHLPSLPIYIEYKHKIYNIAGENIITNISGKIGVTDDTKFKLYKISGIDTSRSIAILVNQQDPKIFVRADAR